MDLTIGSVRNVAPYRFPGEKSTQLPITNYQLTITNYQLPINNYQLHHEEKTRVTSGFTLSFR
jgi:hypothetical protein